MRIQKRSKRSAAGSTLLEFALVAPLIIAILSGLFEFGFAFYIYDGLQSAVRNGARYAAVADFDRPNGDSFVEAVQNVTVYGATSVDPASKPLVPGLATTHVEVIPEMDGKGFPISITVRVQSFEIDLIWLSYTLVRKPSSTFWYQGQTK